MHFQALNASQLLLFFALSESTHAFRGLYRSHFLFLWLFFFPPLFPSLSASDAISYLSKGEKRLERSKRRASLFNNGVKAGRLPRKEYKDESSGLGGRRQGDITYGEHRHPTHLLISEELPTRGLLVLIRKLLEGKS